MAFKLKDLDSTKILDLKPGDIIGRSEGNHCFPECSNMSRSHVQFVVDKNIPYLVDLGSHNGTFINTVKTDPNTRVILANGHIVFFGGKTFIFKSEEK
jgi:pSer/pThr/pTyr-binding forkhead associated (FHA) protein